MHRSLILIAALLLCSCKDGGTEELDSTQSTDTGTEELPPWAEMDDEQKSVYMSTVVTPQMAALFQDFNDERFADFDCESCHGSSVAYSDYGMPGDIDPISQPPPQPGASPISRFMHETVTAEMAALLDQEQSSPGVEGFGCYGCHGVKAPE